MKLSVFELVCSIISSCKKLISLAFTHIRPAYDTFSQCLSVTLDGNEKCNFTSYKNQTGSSRTFRAM